MGNAFHFIVAREDAKKVFAHDAAALQSMLTEWRDDSAREAMRLPSGNDWQAWNSAFESLSNESAENGPLNLVFLGGRPLPEQPGETIRLIRPDMVPHIANLLKQIDRESLNSLADAESRLEQLAAIFDSAADQRSAVLFYAPADD